jgi:hypothetical protein
MRVRQGFVSNSSSSSFVIVGEDPSKNFIPDLKSKKLLRVPHTLGGETLFGRGNEDHTDIGSRVNWAFMQAGIYDRAARSGDTLAIDVGETLPDQPLLPILRRVIKRATGAEIIRVYLNEYDGEMESLDIYEDPDDLESIKTDAKWARDRTVESSLDHGSCWAEKPENLDIFKDEDVLLRFLFNRESKICERGDG